ncbi:MAG: ribosome biogenesis factor YjgA [Rhodanobacter sp.]
MSSSRTRNQTELDDTDYGPSRTQQRREALAVLALATQLVELQPTRLAKLELPEDVRREVDITRRTPSHGAHKRQLAFLAKVMRRYDAADFAAVHAELGENRERQREENAVMHRMEAMRDRLLSEDPAALPELISAHPQVDTQRLRALIRQARSEQAVPNKPQRAYREIFRVLKDLSETDSPSEPAA